MKVNRINFIMKWFPSKEEIKSFEKIWVNTFRGKRKEEIKSMLGKSEYKSLIKKVMNVQIGGDETALMWSIRNDWEDVALWLIHKKADLQEGKDGLDLIRWSVERGLVETTKALIDRVKKEYINEYMKEGFLKSIECHQKEIFDILLSKENNLSEDVFKKGLSLAINHHQVEMVEVLLKKAAKMSWQDEVWIKTVNWVESFKAITPDDVDRKERWLKELTADSHGLMCKDKNEDNALMWSIKNKKIDTIKMLIQKKNLIQEVDKDGNTVLMELIKINEKDAAKKLIDQECLINEKNFQEDSALFCAIKRKNKEIVEYLLNKNVLINRKNENGLSELMLAAHIGDEEVFNLILSKGALKRGQDNFGRNLLMHAIYGRNSSIIKKVLELSSALDIEFQDCEQKNSLRYAWINGDLDLASELVKRNPNVLKKDNNNEPHATWCVKATSERSFAYTEKTLEWLMKNGGDINEKDSRGYTALMCSTMSTQYLFLGLLLLKLKAKTEEVSNGGDTALKLAIVLKRKSLAKKIIQEGQSLNIKDKDGKTALNLAVVLSDEEMVTELIENGADLNIEDNQKETPLMKAVLQDQHKTVKALIEKGVLLDQKDKKGRTALLWACDRSNDESFRLLLKSGAGVNHQDNEGCTALMIAAKKNQVQKVRELIQAKANLFIKNKQEETVMDIAKSLGYQTIQEELNRGIEYERLTTVVNPNKDSGKLLRL